jgi:hypothetical protein
VKSKYDASFRSLKRLVELKEIPIELQFMLKTIEGIYQDGQIQLTELPQGVRDRSQVLVTFLDPSKIDPAKLRQLIDQLETIAGIQQGFEDLNSGQTRSIGDFVQEMQQKYGISG